VANRVLDSFDHYATAQLTNKWTQVFVSPAVTAAIGRNGTAGLRLGDSQYGLRKVSSAADQYHYVGVGVKVSSVTPGADVPIFSFRDGASEQIDLRITTTGKLRVTRGGTTLATGTFVFTIGVYAYVEFAVKIHDTTGTYDVWINGGATPDITGSGADTQTTANANADTFLLFGRTAGLGQTDLDDAFWNSNNAGAETRWGDTRCEYIRPSGNGNSSQWVGSDGNSVDNYLLVDETSPNDDTDYVASSTVNDLDLYTFTDVTPTTGGVKLVVEYLWARKDDAGTRTIAGATREGGTTSVGANQDLSTSYNYYREAWALNPRTAAAWSISEVNGSEFGAKEIA
jgi:hypothetical protein